MSSTVLDAEDTKILQLKLLKLPSLVTDQVGINRDFFFFFARMLEKSQLSVVFF